MAVLFIQIALAEPDEQIESSRKRDVERESADDLLGIDDALPWPNIEYFYPVWREIFPKARNIRLALIVVEWNNDRHFIRKRFALR